MKSACASQAVEFARACRREAAGNVFREIISPISAFSLSSDAKIATLRSRSRRSLLSLSSIVFILFFFIFDASIVLTLFKVAH